MKALFDFFSKEAKAGSDTFVLSLKKDSSGDFRFVIRSMSGEKIAFYLSRSGLSPLDNRHIFGEDDL